MTGTRNWRDRLRQVLENDPAVIPTELDGLLSSLTTVIEQTFDQSTGIHLTDDEVDMVRWLLDPTPPYELKHELLEVGEITEDEYKSAVSAFKKLWTSYEET